MIRLIWLALALLSSGCDSLSPEWKARIRDSIEVLTGRSITPAPSGRPAVAAAVEPAQQGSANAELLQEMFRIVLIREPTDRSEFAGYVNSLNQGASLEGIYNGFSHSADYRKLEVANANASPEALKLFARELALIEAELPEVTPFDERSALPLAHPVQPGGDPVPEAEPVGDGAMPNPIPRASPDVKALTDRYTTLFIGTSIYTLKRLLADEALKLIASKKEYREKLALWYSRWAVRAASLGVDFGLAQRNLPDEQFHYRWALGAGEDRVTWEVLNRLHRLLNDANRPKQ